MTENIVKQATVSSGLDKLLLSRLREVTVTHGAKVSLGGTTYSTIEITETATLVLSGLENDPELSQNLHRALHERVAASVESRMSAAVEKWKKLVKEQQRVR
jgi:hypothetical protein